MSYPAIVAGIATALRTIPDLVVLEYEPRTLALRQAVYFLLDGFDRTQSGQITAMVYRVNCRICVRWQDNAQAEQDMAALINPVCAAIDADAQLGSAISAGLARVTSATAEYADIGGTGAINYRVCNVIVTVTEKASYRSGI